MYHKQLKQINYDINTISYIIQYLLNNYCIL